MPSADDGYEFHGDLLVVLPDREQRTPGTTQTCARHDL
jgi:hypothetical protein